MNIDPFEGNVNTKIGLVAHKMFEIHNQENFNFDEAFDLEISKLDFTNEELPIVYNLKAQIKKASESIKLHQKHMKNPVFLTEKRIAYTFAPHSRLLGFLDKTIILDSKYIAIVDYKTGNDSFAPEKIQYGDSLQLPTYCLLSSVDKELRNYDLIGVFINNVINPKVSYTIEDDALIDPYLKLNGKVLADLSVISLLDDTAGGKKAEFIKGVSTKVNGELKETSSLASKSEFDEYAKAAEEKFKEADTRIRNNDFPINPLYYKNSDNACQYCPYKDICCVKASQRRYPLGTSGEESEEETDE